MLRVEGVLECCLMVLTRWRVHRARAADRGDLEYGDKIILPQQAFRDITRLKLPFPLLFEVRKTKAGAAAPDRHGKAKQAARQLCSVLEFSGPDNQGESSLGFRTHECGSV
jgi:hypothetical protein